MFSVPSFSGFKIPSTGFKFLLLSGTWTSPFNRIYSTSNKNNSANATFNNNIGSGIDNYVWNFFPYLGKILFGGFFTTYDGVPAPYFAEINPNGTLSRTGIGSGFNQSVRAIHIQPDGKIICAGTFTSYNSVGISRIVRLNADFTIDATFNVGAGFDNEVNHLVSDGTHIYVIGGFTTYKGVSRNKFVKIRISDGTDDTGVNTGFNTGTNFGIAIKNNDIYITGDSFTSYNGGSVPARICKINKNTLVADATFTFNLNAGANNRTYCYSSIDDNFLYVIGNFSTISGVARNNVARIGLNGVLDSTFPTTPPSGGNVLFGRLVNNNTRFAIAGNFTNFGGVGTANRFGAYDVATKGIDANYNGNFSSVCTTIGEF
jgi:hypothetical protein